MRAAAAWEGVVTELVAQRGDALLRYATLLCGSRDDAADLVQDALVRTFGRLRNGFSVESAEAYVRRAILNGHLDGWRLRTRHCALLSQGSAMLHLSTVFSQAVLARWRT